MKKLAIIGTLLVAGGLLTYMLVMQGWAGIGGNSPSPLSTKSGNHYPVQIKGFSYSSYDSAHHRQVFKIKADEFKVQPRKLWLFNVNPINEATLTNVVLEVHFGDDQTSSPVDLFSFADDLLPHKKGEDVLKGVGLITRGIVKGFILKVYDKEDRLLIEVNAEKGEIDLSGEEVTFENVKISKGVDGEVVTSRMATWDRQEKVFKIPGEYVIVAQDKLERGRNMRMGLDSALASM